MSVSPRGVAEALERAPPSVPADDEVHVGYGIMGQPFASGHVLALRRFVSSSLGAAYTSVWHRSPQGVWTVYTDVEAARSCPRYFGAAIARAERAAIRLTWEKPDALSVQVGDKVDWTSRIHSTPATRAMTMMAGVMPPRAWRSPPMLAAMAATARLVLRTGPLRMRGESPNGQWYRVAPRRMWSVLDAQATIDRVDIGRPGPIEPQATIGDFLIPQRGIFAAGRSTFERREHGRSMQISRGDPA